MSPRAAWQLEAAGFAARGAIGQVVASRGFDAGSLQDASDEFALGLRIGVPALALISAEVFLQLGVVGAKALLGSQRVLKAISARAWGS